MVNANESYSDIKKHKYEYLLFYVNFLDRLIKRMGAYEIKLQPCLIGVSKVAILTDPNGIQIRLIEAPDEVSGSGNTFARLGYYSIESSDVNSV